MTIGLTWRFLDDSTFLMSSHNCFPWSEFFEYCPSSSTFRCREPAAQPKTFVEDHAADDRPGDKCAEPRASRGNSAPHLAFARYDSHN